MANSELTHLNRRGEAQMVNVGGKDVTQRSATARGYVTMQRETLQLIERGDVRKGDALAVARIAGIQAAKKCADLIPLCHPLMLTQVEVDIAPEPESNRVRIEATCALAGRTGVEMEALTAVSVAALALYDMCKAADKNMVVSDIRLIAKTGGKSGDWFHDAR